MFLALNSPVGRLIIYDFNTIPVRPPDLVGACALPQIRYGVSFYSRRRGLAGWQRPRPRLSRRDPHLGGGNLAYWWGFCQKDVLGNYSFPVPSIHFQTYPDVPRDVLWSSVNNGASLGPVLYPPSFHGLAS